MWALSCVGICDGLIQNTSQISPPPFEGDDYLGDDSKEKIMGYE